MITRSYPDIEIKNTSEESMTTEGMYPAVVRISIVSEMEKECKRIDELNVLIGTLEERLKPILPSRSLVLSEKDSNALPTERAPMLILLEGMDYSIDKCMERIRTLIEDVAL